MARTHYEITSGGSGSYTTYGFWLDERPSINTPAPAYENMLVSIPFSNKQLDFSGIYNGPYYPDGRDFTFKFRKVKDTGDEHDIVTDAKNFYAWLTSLINVAITDTWNGKTFNNCTVTNVEITYPNNYGYEAIVNVDVHTVNAKDINGVL